MSHTKRRKSEGEMNRKRRKKREKTSQKERRRERESAPWLSDESSSVDGLSSFRLSAIKYEHQIAFGCNMSLQGGVEARKTANSCIPFVAKECYNGDSFINGFTSLSFFSSSFLCCSVRGLQSDSPNSLTLLIYAVRISCGKYTEKKNF